jgi:hypothetical protein
VIDVAVVGTVCGALGAVAGAFASYYKCKPSSNGNGHPKICAAHESMVQRFVFGEQQFSELRSHMSEQGKQISAIGVAVGRIEGALKIKE